MEISVIKRELPKPNLEAISTKKHALQSLEDLASKRWIPLKVVDEFCRRQFEMKNLKELNLGQIQKVREAIKRGILR